MKQVENFIKSYLKKDIPDIRPGDEVRISQKIREDSKEEKERIQFFEGTVIARARKKEMGATITVRRIISGIGVEKIFPIHSPNIAKIEILKKGKPKRAKLYYLRGAKGKRAKLKMEE